MAETTASQAKLIQYLNEAYSKEKELEVSLQAHIGMTTLTERKAYKKRLQDHLKETRSHSKQVERRIKKLGGTPGILDSPVEAIASGAGKVAAVAKGQVAAAKGPLHMVRGTSDQEKLLKNAKTEYFNEHEEIATYSAIETLADAVGDTETAKLARGIRREEERMAKYLDGLIPTLTKAVVKEEIPASERKSPRRRSSRSSSSRTSSNASRSNSGSSRSKSGSSRSRSSSGSRSKPSTGSRSKSSGSRAKSSSSRTNSSGSRSRSRSRS